VSLPDEHNRGIAATVCRAEPLWEAFQSVVLAIPKSGPVQMQDIQGSASKPHDIIIVDNSLMYPLCGTSYSIHP